jgi:hypothetical protein
VGWGNGCDWGRDDGLRGMAGNEWLMGLRGGSGVVAALCVGQMA